MASVRAVCDNVVMSAVSVHVLNLLPSTLVLWDVDHTLIENGGVSKATYATAHELLTGHFPMRRPVTDGRTDFQIMHELLSVNSDGTPPNFGNEQLSTALKKAMELNASDLSVRGFVLPGVVAALQMLSNVPDVIQSVLTGNIAVNAHVKLREFNLDKWVDFNVGGFGSDDIVRSKLVDASRRKVATKYRIEFDQSSTVLIGDTILDVRAAQDGGAKVIAVATGVYTVAQLMDAGADAVLESLADVGQFAEALLAVRAGT
jgi:phosphoglycolate phosphatase